MRKFVLRLSTLFVLMVAVLSGVALFWVSQQVQQLERDQRLIRQQVSSEQEGIRVLSAEWDYLNRPERLEYLANRYLKNMERVAPENLLSNANALPQKLDAEEETSGIIQVVAPEKKPSSIKKISRKVDDVPQAPIRDNVSAAKNDFDSVLKQIEAGADE